ncbi:MAG: ELWxxDGT repeat protein, partial [Flavobacteriales bacterium]
MRSSLLSLLFGASGSIMLCTAQTPTLLKDINPSGASNIANMTCIDGTVYFQATDGVHGSELWKSDGTVGGTVMVKDLLPGADGSFPKDFMAVNGSIYFTTNELANGVRLWRTDGTENGTELALTLAVVPGLLEWMTFVPLGDRIFFRGHETTTGRELWSTDGTPGGTQLFMDIHPGSMNSGFQNPMAHDGKIYFSASDGT